MAITVNSDTFSIGAVYSFNEMKMEWHHTWGTKDKSLIGTSAPFRMNQELNCRAIAMGYSEHIFYPNLSKPSVSKKESTENKSKTFIPLFK